jgi:hypothetical protein
LLSLGVSIPNKNFKNLVYQPSFLGFRSAEEVGAEVAPYSLSPPHVLVKEFYIRSDGAYSPDYSVMAGLTMIPAKNAPVLTASVLNKDGYWNGVG